MGLSEIPPWQSGFWGGADTPPPIAATLLYTTCKKKQSFRPGLCSYFLFCPDSPNTFADFLSFTQNVHDSTGRRGASPHPVLALGLLDPAQLVGDDQLFQVVDLLPQGLALVHILHQNAAVLLFQHAFPRDDVDVLGDGLFGADEGLVGPQGHIPAGIGQGVAGDAGLFVVGAAEPAVNDDQPAAALDGALAVFLLHRHVPVDDVARPRQPELGQDAPAGGLLVIPGVIGVLDLGVGGLVRHIQPLECGHGAAAEQRRQLAAPQVPQKVLAALAGGAAL